MTMKFLILVLSVQLVVELSLLLRYFLVRRSDRVGAARTGATPVAQRSLYFLLPALREQNAVFSTLSVFTDLCRGHARVKVVVITTEREEHEKARHGFSESTADLVLKYKQQHDNDDRIVHLHYPRIDGNKSHQLNYAVDWLRRNGATIDDYVAIYDFDAKPAANTVEEFFASAGGEAYDAIQQVPLPVRRIEQRLADGRAACVAESVLHLQRSLPIEKWRLLFNDRSGLRLLPHYLCGSGMFVRLESFDKYGQLPFVDDVPFGYRLYVYGARMGVLTSYNQVDAHLSIRAVVNSNVFVFNGVIRFFDEIAYVATRGLNASTIGRSVLLLLFGLFEVFEFVIYPALLVISLLTTLLTGNTVLLLLALTLLFFPMIAVLAARKLVAEQIGYPMAGVHLLAVLSAAPARKFWRAAGPLIYCFRKLKSVIVAKPVTYGKTER